MQVFFIILLGLVFFAEGIGLNYGREAAYSLILVIPLSLFLLDALKKKPIIIPKKITVLFGIFFIFSAVSTVLAVNVAKSFEYLLYYISTFLIFIYAYNHKDIKKTFPAFIYAISFAFAVYSTFINHFLPPGWDFLIPTRWYQYVYAFFKTHNALGTLLLVPIILSFSSFIIQKKSKYLMIFLVFLPFFLFSYSRSAYLAFIEAESILLAYRLKQGELNLFSGKTMIASLVFGLCLSFFVVTVNYTSAPGVVKTINGVLGKYFRLNNKTFLSNRNLYFRSAMLSIREKPFFGVGPNNFVYASALHATNTGAVSETADNIFLEVFSENGILAGIVYMVIVALILIKADKKNLALFITLIGMVLLFQTDSSQRYYSYYLLFTVLAGLLYKEREESKGTSLVFPTAVILWLVAGLIFLSNLSYDRRDYKTAFYLYPFNQQVFEKYLEAVSLKNGLWKIYRQLYGGDLKALSIVAKKDSQIGDRKAELADLKKISRYFPYHINNLNVFYKTYRLERDLNGQEKADRLAEDFFKRLENARKEAAFEANYRQNAKNVCALIYNICPFRL